MPGEVDSAAAQSGSGQCAADRGSGADHRGDGPGAVRHRGIVERAPASQVRFVIDGAAVADDTEGAHRRERRTDEEQPLQNHTRTCRVGTLSRKPLSVTSSTVSPMLSTSVALEKDTTM